MKKIKIDIFDTTLRDGQQCPGAGLGFEHNIVYAKLAAKVGVDVLEAGFPAASKLDFEIVKTIAQELSHKPQSPIIAGLCQLREEQVYKTIEALKDATVFNKARLHVYVPVDPNLMVASLGEKLDKQKIIKDVSNFISLSSKEGLQVEFSPEGYSRQAENFDFTTDLIRAAVDSGATIINCPDTAGAASRFQSENYFVNSMNQHAEIINKEFPDKIITWSVHCHNDFGLALDNSLQGIFHGPATQVEGCFNGIGERAGNVALEQVIMTLKYFGVQNNCEFYTDIKTEHIKEISDFIAKYMLPRQPHSPICGDNASKHTSGGHTNAVLKAPTVYQGFDPKEVGMEVALSFGPLSGGNHAKDIILKAGFICDDSEKANIAQYVKDYYKDRRKGVTDSEVVSAYIDFRKPIDIETFDYSRRKEISEVHLTGKFFDQAGEIIGKTEGRDSALSTLKNLVDQKYPGFEIFSYQSASVGEGITALSESTIIVRRIEAVDAKTYTGIGQDRDIEISAMKAYLAAINSAYVYENYATK
jgi:2-isopropylmalate synthase